jgi:predicted ferric reductase
MCLAMFLAMKNTPLSPIAGRSYESINVLHRWCGYTTILLMTVHTAYVTFDPPIELCAWFANTPDSVYAAGLFATDYVHLLTTPGTIAADVAGIAMILILLTANGYVRRRHYEFFYIAHTILIIVSLITGK